MSRKLTQLPDFSLTSLDWDSIINETKQLILDHPEYNLSWDDFLSSNSGMMLLELFSFIVEKYCTRIDWISKQLFISTATDRQAIINLLKLINHRPLLPTAAKVNASLKLTKWIEPFYLLGNNDIYGLDLNGSMATFELIENSDDGKPNYSYTYFVDTGTETAPVLEFYNIPFYHGSKVTESDVYMEGLDNEYFDLQSYPVIENSIRIFSVSRNNVELPEVDSYISPEAQQNNVLEKDKLPPYTIEINSDNQVRVKFGSASLVKIATKGERLLVTYRVGGGSAYNLVSNSINITKTFQDSSGRRATGIFVNPNPGFGGTEAEDLNQAKLIAPITLRSANKTVTRDDYVSNLEISPLVMKAQIIGKENEPQQLFADVGYTLPPLDTWIYIVPQRDNWEITDPTSFNSLFKIGRPYDYHAEIDYEDILITQINQSYYLKKYRKNKGYKLYVTLHETTAENVDWLWRDSYLEITDYTINTITGMFTRIATGDGGNIPPGDRILRIRYINEVDQATFKQNTAMQFINGVILLDTSGSGRLYTGKTVVITDITGKITYVEGVDYNLNYTSNMATTTVSSRIGKSDRVIVRYANHWMTGQEDTSEEKLILNIISNKKMICVDNYIKDSIYSTFDIAATVYCTKNLIKKITADLEPNLRNLFSLNNANYDTAISKADIIKKIMAMDGITHVEVTYLGRNYEVFRRYLLNTLTIDEVIAQGANTNEYKIDCSYNEIILLSNDEYDGYKSVENKKHGLMISYKENT